MDSAGITRIIKNLDYSGGLYRSMMGFYNPRLGNDLLGWMNNHLFEEKTLFPLVNDHAVSLLDNLVELLSTQGKVPCERIVIAIYSSAQPARIELLNDNEYVMASNGVLKTSPGVVSFGFALPQANYWISLAPKAKMPAQPIQSVLVYSRQ